MTLTRKDAVATAFTALIVLVFFAVHESWNVPLVGDSVRWATAAVLVLGIGSCAQGTAGQGTSTLLLGSLGAVALGLAVIALVTGSLTALSLLVAADVVLWAVTTARHAFVAPHTPHPAS